MSPPQFRIQTAERHVHSYLHDCILKGKLRGGERIDQNAIASQLGVSRMPVREAIRRLESEGLVVSRPHRGATVTALGSQAVLELFEMRGALEGLAVSLALRSMDEETFAKFFNQLEEQLQRLDRVKASPTIWLQHHDEFHDYICQAAHRPYLAATTQKLRQAVIPYMRLYLSAYKEAEIPGFDHHRLLEGMKPRDPVLAESMMREHILSAAKGAIKYLERSAEEGEGGVLMPSSKQETVSNLAGAPSLI